MNLLDERFDYTYAITNRYLMPNIYIKIGNKKVRISLIVSNGFVKLYSIKGRVYWIQQMRRGALAPDWKIHFNINHDDIPKAWKIISESLLYHKIKHTKEQEIIDDIFVSMKAINTNLNKNFPQSMDGREITVYIYMYDELLNEDDGNGLEINCENEEGVYAKKEIKYRKNEEEKFDFWKEFLIDTEKKLLKEKIRTKKIGAADGDLFLGKYCSLRNETFYFSKYPENDKGWNATKKKMPFNFYQIFLLRYYLYYKDKFILKNFFAISIIILFLIIVFSLFHSKI